MATCSNGVPYMHDLVTFNRPTKELPTGWYTPFFDYRRGGDWQVKQHKLPDTMSSLNIQKTWFDNYIRSYGTVLQKTHSFVDNKNTVHLD